jgi:hypothetical protein
VDLDAAFAAMRESYEGWLAEHGATPPLGAYVGYELVPAMVEAARELHADPRARFEVGTEVREEADYARRPRDVGALVLERAAGGAGRVDATARRCSTSLCSCAAAG